MSDKNMIVEERMVVETVSDDNKQLYLKGTFMEAGTRNGNGRVYDIETLERVCRQINEAAKDGQGILGELDHPESLTVSAKNVAIQLKEAEMVDNRLVCKALVLPTPAGKIVKDLANAGVSLGVSTRGAGNIVEGRVRDYEFVTVDVVCTPSVSSARPETIYEGYSLTRGDEFSTAIREDDEAQAYFTKELVKFIESLNTSK